MRCLDDKTEMTLTRHTTSPPHTARFKIPIRVSYLALLLLPQILATKNRHKSLFFLSLFTSFESTINSPTQLCEIMTNCRQLVSYHLGKTFLVFFFVYEIEKISHARLKGKMLRSCNTKKSYLKYIKFPQ